MFAFLFFYEFVMVIRRWVVKHFFGSVFCLCIDNFMIICYALLTLLWGETMQKNVYEEIANGNREAIQTEIEKQKANLEKYIIAVYENVNAKKMCLFSINGIKELMFSVSEIAQRYGYEDLQIKAGFVATSASELENKFVNEINAQQKSKIIVNGFEAEIIE